MQNVFSSGMSVTPPSFPTGGGALTGMGESLGQAGPDGMSSLSVPLPLSAGRGSPPSLTLNYSSGAGNGSFGIGWSCSPRSISLRTRHGTPQYDGQDTFLGPDGEVLVAETDGDGQPVTTTVSHYGDVTLSTTYTVTRYFPRVEGAFERLEFWQSDGISPFWLLHGRDGTLHMLGKTASARIADPASPSHIAVWLYEESVNPIGEHIWYQYRAENSDNIVQDGRDCSAMRYLTQVNYGNTIGETDLFLWSGDDVPGTQTWLFTLVFDYGERSTDPTVIPSFVPASDASWSSRQDPFSRYDYGFDVRSWRLCRQVLMFHHFPAELGDDATLVRRLLLEYNENPVMTQMSALQTLAYETDGTLKSLPPLELDYTAQASITQASWSPLPALPGLNDGQRYSLTDLYGEGVPGVLYQAGQDWRYCPPVRDVAAGADSDAVTWSTEWVSLPTVPAMSGSPLHLMDITGEGHQDLVVAQPGLSGYFSLESDGSWGPFTPFTTLPLEFFHPQSQLAQLAGSGLADLVLVSPGTVRLYTNTGAGFEAGLDVAQDQTVLLPEAGRDARAWVGFADVLGSGQPHLTEIRFNQVRVWPSLGHGRFGPPITFSVSLDAENTFDPERLFLADTDGSGAPDLVYAGHNSLQIFTNLAGNGFAAPTTLALPAGVIFDRLCQLTPADLNGNGCSGLVLTVPYMTPQHWVCTFAGQKPYLLASIVNNLGASQTLTYRSSAQFWLDEKRENPLAIPALPFPVQLLSNTLSTDELTENTLGRVYRYRQGVYDGKEREFRGFGYLETQDTSTDALPSGDDTPLASPLLSRYWYHCGRENDDTALYGSPWAGDPQAPTLNAVRLTQWNDTDGQDDAFTPDPDTRWWMYRALKGSLLRSEIWDAQTYTAQGAPFDCHLVRSQVRLVQPGAMPVVWPSTLESLQTGYEALAIDPQIDHLVTLEQDKYGSVLWQASVFYPRRPEQPLTPYPDNLPADAWEASYDDQQTILRIQELRASVFNLEEAQVWHPGLPSQQRQNLLTALSLPTEGISYETLIAANGLLSDAQPRSYRGQSEVVYRTQPPTALPALVDHICTAVLDDVALQAYEGIAELDNFDFTSVGYHTIPVILDTSSATQETVLAVNSGPVVYDTAACFYRLLSQQNTDMANSPALTFTWDDYSLAIRTQTDRLGNAISSEYDYRFLLPRQITDINNNTHEALYDALGYGVSSSHYGTENGGISTGFELVSDHPELLNLSLDEAINNALAPGYIQPVATVMARDMQAWMGQVTEGEIGAKAWQTLLEARYITAQGAVRPAGHRWAQNPTDNPDIDTALAPVLAATGGMPVCSVVLTADNYPTQAGQQTQISLSYSDGFGRSLQQCSLVAPGDAWQREDDGEVNTQTAPANPRWAVSGRVEYDNKGQAIRQYQPFFINSWEYVIDSSLRTQGYSDTTYYDALGRADQVITAAGYLRRTTFYAWFTVSEDENDTDGLSRGENR